MEIIWDGYGLKNLNSGIGIYSQSLAKEFHQSNRSYSIVTFDELSSKDFFDSRIIRCPNNSKILKKIKTLKINWSNSLYKQYNVTHNTGKSTIWHGLSNFNIPTHPNNDQIKKVVTIHDIIPLLAPESVSKSYYLQFKYLLPKVLKSAHQVICVSDWTKSNIIRLYPQYESKLNVITNGFSEYKFSLNQRNPDLKQKTLLTVGRSETYKRLDFLPKILEKLDLNFQLIIVTDANGKAKLEYQFQNLISNNRLSIFHNVPHDNLMKLYQQADLYLHPSIYEGFCLPAAEALSMGIPVIYQSGSAINEVVGNKIGSPLEKNANIAQWCDHIYKFADKKFNEQYQIDLINYLDKKMNWQKNATAVWSIYEKCFE